MVYRLKSSDVKSAADAIGQCAAQFIDGLGWEFDLIVPMPSSKARLSYQPVDEIARTTALGVGCPVAFNAIGKKKNTAELKDVEEYGERLKMFYGAFEAEAEVVTGRHVLLVDDLYRSGATARAATEALLAAGRRASGC
jgi:predicted amidophosphoribosyltransferase